MQTAKICGWLLMLLTMSLMNSSLALAQIQDKWKEPRKESKMDFLYKASNVYLAGGTALDSFSTARFMNYNAVARRSDGVVLGRFYGQETGWAACFGKRNAFAAVSANAALNVGVGWLSRRLYRRGGKWRVLAIGLNFVKGTDSLAAGYHNITFNRDLAVQQATGYRGRIVWSH